jgi:head-tail adaptor
MFDDGELTSMRTAFEGLMPDTCNVLTVTNTSNGQGGFTQTWGTAGTAVRCRIDSIRGSEAVAGGAVYPLHQMVVTLPYNEVVSTEGRIEHSGILYNVVAVDSDKSWKITTRAVCEVVNG